MATIKAPYNFVPFNKQVVSPHWIEQISHDIPFADGLSGAIEVKFKAQSPIFVRDGIGQKQAKGNYDEKGIQQRPHIFSRFGNRYFIPGTSIKGMVRNVLEILSFGRMEDKVNNHKYALRDLSGAMKDKYLKDFKPDKIYCGWLKKNSDNSYSITDCGLPGRITHKEIDRVFRTNISTYFSTGGRFNPKKDYEKSAQKKYAAFGANNVNQRFTFDRDDVGRKIYAIDPNGDKEGALIFTGQPGFRQQRNGKWSGHHLEFIFFKDNETDLPVPQNVMQDFFFAYYEQDKPKWSEDWKVWRVKLNQGESIPVFFHKEEDRIKSLGLSYLYKLPYNNSVIDAITHYQGKDKPDLSEAIFGHVAKNDALKGRVHVGHAFASEGAEVDEEKKEVLSGPKASYYPNYMRQDVGTNGVMKGRYTTFMDKGAEISGWKRYPVHSNAVKHNSPPENTESEKILTKFIPLKAGAEFTFTIRYHNLRPIELGALLSALTFHRTANTYHSIGMAKPLGYGKVSLTIENAEKLDIPKYLGVFEAYMNVQLGKTTPTWHTEEQVTELVTMAQEHGNANLTYMSLDDHVLAKNDKLKDQTPKPREGLAKYSALVSNKATVASHCDADTIAEMKRACDEESKSYLHTDNVEEVVNITLRAAKNEIETLWRAKKAQLLEQIAAKQVAIAEAERAAKDAQEAAERAKRREEDAKKVEESGPNFDQVDLSNWRKAKDTIVKVVEAYGIKYYMQSDIKKIVQQNPSGYLPEKYHGQLLEILKKIFQFLPQSEKDKWLAPYNKNPMLKKVAESIGEEKAKNITFK